MSGPGATGCTGKLRLRANLARHEEARHKLVFPRHQFRRFVDGGASFGGTVPRASKLARDLVLAFVVTKEIQPFAEVTGHQ